MSFFYNKKYLPINSNLRLESFFIKLNKRSTKKSKLINIAFYIYPLLLDLILFVKTSKRINSWFLHNKKIRPYLFYKWRFLLNKVYKKKINFFFKSMNNSLIKNNIPFYKRYKIKKFFSFRLRLIYKVPFKRRFKNIRLPKIKKKYNISKKSLLNSKFSNFYYYLKKKKKKNSKMYLLRRRRFLFKWIKGKKPIKYRPWFNISKSGLVRLIIRLLGKYVYFRKINKNSSYFLKNKKKKKKRNKQKKKWGLPFFLYDHHLTYDNIKLSFFLKYYYNSSLESLQLFYKQLKTSKLFFYNNFNTIFTMYNRTIDNLFLNNNNLFINNYSSVSLKINGIEIFLNKKKSQILSYSDFVEIANINKKKNNFYNDSILLMFNIIFTYNNIKLRILKNKIISIIHRLLFFKILKNNYLIRYKKYKKKTFFIFYLYYSLFFKKINLKNDDLQLKNKKIKNNFFFYSYKNHDILFLLNNLLKNNLIISNNTINYNNKLIILTTFF